MHLSGLPPALPIDPLLPSVVAGLLRDGALVLHAPPGAGKTTRVPPALLAAGVAAQGEILVVQPRRLPARLAATRVAHEMSEPVGRTVGYTVRFEDESGPATRVRFITEGILMRRLIENPHLPGVAAVLLDEFHERHLDADVALGLLRSLRAGARPDLRLCVMSATLEPEPIAEFLARDGGACGIARSEGRRFPIDIEYSEGSVDRPLEDRVAAVARRVLQGQAAGERPVGDLLVFLPGAAEIRRATVALTALASERNLLVLALHGDLPLGEQGRVVEPAAQRKVILSTNVAETSVTIAGVTAVIDSGLARVAVHSPWTGLPGLRVQKISQAAAIQRAGRAGRTGPGCVVRLFGRADFDARPAFDLPEVARMDLSGALLSLATAGITQPETWEWFERPPGALLSAGADLLRQTGACAGDGSLTATGRAMLRFPVHPRLARLLVEGERRGVARDAAVLAALLSERDIRRRARAYLGPPAGAGRGAPPAESADLFEVLDLFEQARAAGFSRDRLRALDLDDTAVAGVDRAARQFVRAAERPTGSTGNAADTQALDRRDEKLALCVLAAFPDRVARRRRVQTTTGARDDAAVLCGGGSARVPPTPGADLLVAVDVAENATGNLVRLAVGIEPEALIEVHPDGVAETSTRTFNPETGRVDLVHRVAYGAIVLEETRRPAEPSPETAEVLAAAVRAAGVVAFVDPAALAALQARLQTLRSAYPERDIPACDEATLMAAAAGLFSEHNSLAGLRAADLLATFTSQLAPEVQTHLRSETPGRLILPGGRSIEIHYELDRPPWVESRLQDFFGMKTGPSVCAGRVPLTLHLLAPNQRAVQVTQDLAGFWRQHYPALRNQLSRRYPRHAWPEDGATARPPEPRPPLSPRARSR